MRAGGEQASDEGLEPLKLQRYRARPSTTAVVAQTWPRLAVIFVASQLFVQQLEWAGPALGLPSAVVAPAAVAGRDRAARDHERHHLGPPGQAALALANISGAMMIQATVPTGIGLLFTAWKFDTPLVLAGVATAASIVYLLCILRARRLTAGKARRGDRVLRRLRGRSRAHALSPGPGQRLPGAPAPGSARGPRG